MSAQPPVAILCGGRGTRLLAADADVPKPLVEIGGRPIVWHVIRLYAHHGFTRFLLLTGYKGDRVAEFTRHAEWPQGVSVECIETGIDTPTGGRVHRAAAYLGGERFCLTYADGVADVDLGAQLVHHAAHGKLATVTVVRPELPFGIVSLDGEAVHGFVEKPRADAWINGGFFVLEPGVQEYLGDSSIFEREPLEGLAADGELRAFRHTGFWECMDTLKDAQKLNDLWVADESAPWAMWEGAR